MTGGHVQAVKNQRKIMDQRDTDYTTKPDLSADILHLNNQGPKSFYYAWKAQRKEDIKVVIGSHQSVEDLKNSFLLSNYWSKPLRPYLEKFYSLADLLLCPSEKNRKDMEYYTDVEKKVVSNGFDSEKLEGFEDLRQEYLEKYDLEPPVVFNVGHVIMRKGLDAFVETAREMPELDFVWFGFLNPMGKGDSSILQGRKAKKLVENSPENCTFTGYIEDIRGGFAAGDIFFFPTRNENEGIALLEAMHCGKPVVIRDIETYEWLEDEVDCLKTSDNFAAELKKLKDEERRQKLGRAAEEKSKKFRLENVGEKLMSTYRNLED